MCRLFDNYSAKKKNTETKTTSKIVNFANSEQIEDNRTLRWDNRVFVFYKTAVFETIIFVIKNY